MCSKNVLLDLKVDPHLRQKHVWLPMGRFAAYGSWKEPICLLLSFETA
jgi:hypothetical protein